MTNTTYHWYDLAYYINIDIMTCTKVLNLVLTLALCLSLVTAEDSFYKFRIYKDFVKDVFEKNLRLVFEKTERLQVKDIELKELGTRMTNVKMSIQP